MHKRIRTPFGLLHLAASEKGITQLSFSRNHAVEVRQQHIAGARHAGPTARYRSTKRPTGARSSGAVPLLKSAEHALRKYFQGNLRAFQEIPTDIKGTVFQKKVWRALKQIPAGKTLSYGAIATRIGHPKAFRAVGAACGSNPVALIVPCHRAVGSGKSLGGFAWGIQRKKKLLRLENPQFQNSER